MSTTMPGMKISPFGGNDRKGRVEMTCVNGYGKGFAGGIYNSPKDFSISASFGSWREYSRIAFSSFCSLSSNSRWFLCKGATALRLSHNTKPTRANMPARRTYIRDCRELKRWLNPSIRAWSAPGRAGALPGAWTRTAKHTVRVEHAGLGVKGGFPELAG